MVDAVLKTDLDQFLINGRCLRLEVEELPHGEDRNFEAGVAVVAVDHFTLVEGSHAEVKDIKVLINFVRQRYFFQSVNHTNFQGILL